MNKEDWIETLSHIIDDFHRLQIYLNRRIDYDPLGGREEYIKYLSKELNSLNSMCIDLLKKNDHETPDDEMDYSDD